MSNAVYAAAAADLVGAVDTTAAADVGAAADTAVGSRDHSH